MIGYRADKGCDIISLWLHRVDCRYGFELGLQWNPSTNGNHVLLPTSDSGCWICAISYSPYYTKPRPQALVCVAGEPGIFSHVIRLT